MVLLTEECEEFKVVEQKGDVDKKLRCLAWDGTCSYMMRKCSNLYPERYRNLWHVSGIEGHS